MPKRSWNLNTVYISERLQECLRPISRCALTTVVAPMGYGKTTAVNWYLLERAKLDEAAVVRISVYSDNLAIFWKSVQEAFSHAGLDFLRAYPCPDDAAGGSLLTDDLCHALAEELLRLGGRLYTVGAEQLRLNHTELSIYAHRCGTELSDAQIESLLYSSEGWFSAIYLNLRTLHERGELPSRSSDIYAMFSAAMIDPLPSKRREFLAVMGLADEFTVEMAETVTGSKNTAAILQTLTEQNAFVKRLPDGVTFRFHHMMKDCAERTFHTMEPRRQAVYHNRYGEWYKTHGQYLHALKFYCLAKNYDAALRVIQRDAGILLTSLGAQQVLNFIAHCPVETLKEHPLSLLVLMRSMFTWRQIPKMLELKELLLAAITEHPDWPESERGDLLGECDLIMSFLMYNDISAMSRLHRSASAQMSRPAISIQSSGGWTFGSPSVLMMFHRAPGAMESELAEMDECMPHYYKVTNHHGQGAETIMRAEALFCQGRFTDAHIELERAYAQVKDNGQINMALCCDFLSRRLSLYTDVEQRYTFEERYAELLRYHDASWINLWSAASAYYHALRGETDSIPEIFSQHRLSDINMLAPGKPMMEMIENQVYLAQGAYAKVIGHSAQLLAVCEAMHYALVALHIRIQTAAAYAQLGKSEEACTWLRQALSDAAPDGLVMPFVENYGYLEEMLARERKTDLIAKITALGETAGARNAASAHPAAFDALTPREFEIVELMAQRLSNREIAEKLYLSEGSVKQYVNQIYSKLHMEGNTRTKRKRLAELFGQKT